MTQNLSQMSEADLLLATSASLRYLHLIARSRKLSQEESLAIGVMWVMHSLIAERLLGGGSE